MCVRWGENGWRTTQWLREWVRAESSTSALGYMLYKDARRIKTGVVLIYGNYNIATSTHSKTVIYNRLRMYDVKTNFSSLIYKIATAQYFKSVLENRRKCRVVNTSFCSSDIEDKLHSFVFRHFTFSPNNVDLFTKW